MDALTLGEIPDCGSKFRVGFAHGWEEGTTAYESYLAFFHFSAWVKRYKNLKLPKFLRDATPVVQCGAGLLLVTDCTCRLQITSIASAKPVYFITSLRVVSQRLPFEDEVANPHPGTCLVSRGRQAGQVCKRETRKRKVCLCMQQHCMATDVEHPPYPKQHAPPPHKDQFTG